MRKQDRTKKRVRSGLLGQALAVALGTLPITILLAVLVWILQFGRF